MADLTDDYLNNLDFMINLGASASRSDMKCMLEEIRRHRAIASAVSQSDIDTLQEMQLELESGEYACSRWHAINRILAVLRSR